MNFTSGLRGCRGCCLQVCLTIISVENLHKSDETSLTVIRIAVSLMLK